MISNNCESFAFYCKTGVSVDITGQGYRLLGFNVIGSIASDVAEAIVAKRLKQEEEELPPEFILVVSTERGRAVVICRGKELHVLTMIQD